MAEHPPCGHPGCGHPRSDHRPGYAYGKWTYMGCDTRPCKCPRYLDAPAPAEVEHHEPYREEPDPEPVDEPPAQLTDLVGLFVREDLEPVDEPTQPAGTVLLAYDAWQCESCGSRYRFHDDDHPCGPLTPVTVTITTRSTA